MQIGRRSVILIGRLSEACYRGRRGKMQPALQQTTSSQRSRVSSTSMREKVIYLHPPVLPWRQHWFGNSSFFSTSWIKSLLWPNAGSPPRYAWCHHGLGTGMREQGRRGGGLVSVGMSHELSVSRGRCFLNGGAGIVSWDCEWASY